jgi:polysaccharide pyruvyl transferase WcaK-like protein
LYLRIEKSPYQYLKAVLSNNCPYDIFKKNVQRAQAGEYLASQVSSPAKLFMRMAETHDLVVALTVHAGILSAIANAPFVHFEYQPKGRDFALSLKWEQFSLRKDHISDTPLIELAV